MEDSDKLEFSLFRFLLLLHRHVGPNAFASVCQHHLSACHREISASLHQLEALGSFAYMLILKTDFFVVVVVVGDSFCITKAASLPALGICCLLQLTRQFVQCLLSSPCQIAWKI